jgi:hypothetical protein
MSGGSKPIVGGVSSQPRIATSAPPKQGTSNFMKSPTLRGEPVGHTTPGGTGVGVGIGSGDGVAAAAWVGDDVADGGATVAAAAVVDGEGVAP